MKTQIEHSQIDIEKIRQEIDYSRKWEPWKALVVIVTSIITGVVALSGVILAVAHYIKP